MPWWLYLSLAYTTYRSLNTLVWVLFFLFNFLLILYENFDIPRAHHELIHGSGMGTEEKKKQQQHESKDGKKCRYFLYCSLWYVRRIIIFLISLKMATEKESIYEVFFSFNFILFLFMYNWNKHWKGICRQMFMAHIHIHIHISVFAYNHNSYKNSQQQKKKTVYLLCPFLLNIFFILHIVLLVRLIVEHWTHTKCLHSYLFLLLIWFLFFFYSWLLLLLYHISVLCLPTFGSPVHFTILIAFKCA